MTPPGGIVRREQKLLATEFAAAAISSALWLYAAKTYVGFSWFGLSQTLGKSAAVASVAAAVPLAVSIVLGWRSSEIVTTLLVAVPGAAVGF